jgi:hypothetical protein
MTELHVSLEATNPVEDKLHDALEEQLTSALRAATDRVREQWAGESVDELCERLLAETRSGLHPDIAAGFHPDRAQLRQLAESIVRERSGLPG